MPSYEIAKGQHTHAPADLNLPTEEPHGVKAICVNADGSVSWRHLAATGEILVNTEADPSYAILMLNLDGLSSGSIDTSKIGVRPEVSGESTDADLTVILMDLLRRVEALENGASGG